MLQQTKCIQSNFCLSKNAPLFLANVRIIFTPFLSNTSNTQSSKKMSAAQQVFVRHPDGSLEKSSVVKAFATHIHPGAPELIGLVELNVGAAFVRVYTKRGGGTETGAIILVKVAKMDGRDGQDLSESDCRMACIRLSL